MSEYDRLCSATQELSQSLSAFVHHYGIAEAIARNTDSPSVALNDFFHYCVAKASKHIRAALVLVENEFPEDAIVLSRAAYECYISAAYAKAQGLNAIDDLVYNPVAAAARRADEDESGSTAAPAVHVYEGLGPFRQGELIANVDAATPGADAQGSLFWRDAPQATIQIRPKAERNTEGYVELRNRAIKGSFALRAFGPRGTQWYSQNSRGFIAGDVVSTPIQPRALCVTQLHKHSGMLYGINQALMGEEIGKRFVFGGRVRREFEETLRNYLEFYRLNADFGTAFSLYITVQYVAGLYLRLGSPTDVYEGPIVENQVYHGVDEFSLDAEVGDLLRPLFVKLWDAASCVYEDPR